jgi:hypothetical protein
MKISTLRFISGKYEDEKSITRTRIGEFVQTIFSILFVEKTSYLSVLLLGRLLPVFDIVHLHISLPEDNLHMAYLERTAYIKNP